LFEQEKYCNKIREFSRNQMAFLYRTEEQLNSLKDLLVDTIAANGFDDFILLQFRNFENDRVIYPFVLVFVIQRCSIEYYSSILIDKGWDEAELDCDQSQMGEEEFLVYLEESIYKYIVDKGFL